MRLSTFFIGLFLSIIMCCSVDLLGGIPFKRLCFFGKDIPSAYDFLLHKKKGGIGEARSFVTAQYVMNLAKSAFDKPVSMRTNEEAVALKVICLGIEKLGRNVATFVKKKRFNSGAVILFGGVAEGGGAFYCNLLEKRIKSNVRNKNTRCLLSDLGDQRAILGVVAYGKNKLKNKCGEKKYALGIDIGGTYIRIARVQLDSLTCDGRIIKELNFHEDAARYAMYDLAKIIHSNFKYAQKTTSFLPLSFFLPDVEMQKIHEDLKQIFLKKLFSLIKQELKKSDIAFIGISTAGHMRRLGEVFCASNVPLTGVPIKDMLQNVFGLPVVVINDIVAAGFGEFIAGHAKGLQNFLMVDVGTASGCKVFKVVHNILMSEKPRVVLGAI